MPKRILCNQRPYEQAFFSATPTETTKFFRTCLPWQMVRFIVINIKMTIVILKSH